MKAVANALIILSLIVPSLQAAPKTPKAAARQTSRSDASAAPKGKKPTTPEEIVRTTWPATIAVLQDSSLDVAAKEKEIERLVTPLIDFELMAKLALGKTHWMRLTPSQRKRYVPLFVERIKRSYREKIALYKGEKILIKFPPPGTAKKKSSRIVHVPVELTTKDRQAIVLHKFRKAEKGWKLYDVEIEGVSILLSYRSQFNDILQTGTVEDLLTRLKEEPPRQPATR